MNPNVETLKQFFADINRHELQSLAQYFDPNVVRDEFIGTPNGATFRGIPEILQNVAKGRGSWAEGSCDPEEFLVNGDKVVVYLYAWVRVHGATEWSGGRFADGFGFRNGKIVEYHSFADRSDALGWAGIRPV